MCQHTQTFGECGDHPKEPAAMRTYPLPLYTLIFAVAGADVIATTSHVTAVISPHPDPSSPAPHPDPSSPAPHPDPSSPHWDPSSPHPDPSSPHPDPSSPHPDPSSPHPDPSSPAPHPDPSSPAPHPDPSSPAPHPDPSSPAPHPDPSSPAPHPDPSSPAPHPDPSSPAPHQDPSSPSPHLDPSSPHMDHSSPSHLDHSSPSHLDHSSPSHLDHSSPHLDHSSPHLDHTSTTVQQPHTSPPPHLDPTSHAGGHPSAAADSLSNPKMAYQIFPNHTVQISCFSESGPLPVTYSVFRDRTALVQNITLHSRLHANFTIQMIPGKRVELKCKAQSRHEVKYSNGSAFQIDDETNTPMNEKKMDEESGVNHLIKLARILTSVAPQVQHRNTIILSVCGTFIICVLVLIIIRSRFRKRRNAARS
ncbi:uncharacterized protein LOC142472820 [Ascaphus truei]|uniref:uncharacterized protein LOC142472820 n=1 Tax=Ascaphus truei TaxID=8439 RepID=UPI003F598B5F